MISFTTTHPKIGIFRALQLGDLLCAIPAVRSLRQAYPDAEIVWIGLPWTTHFVQRFQHYIDRCIIFPGYPGLPEQGWSPAAWEAFLERMQEEAFDLIIQMQGNGTVVNRMLQQLGAKQLAGYHRKDCFMPSRLFMEYPDYGHELHRHLLLMQHLGIPGTDPALEFPILPAEIVSLQTILTLHPAAQYVCVHPGSRGAWRQWPPVHFALLADICAEQGYQVILTGTQDELPLTTLVEELMDQSCINLAGKTTLGMVAALINRASLLISNCTSVSHIAAALQTPSIVISMDGEPKRWGPLNTTLHKTIDWTVNDSFDHVREQMGLLMDSMMEAGSRR